MPISTVGIIAAQRQVGGGGTTGSYVSTNSSTSNTTTYTFTAQAIGTPAADRRVVVAIAGRDTVTVPTSVTVGGVGLTEDIFEGNTPLAAIYSEVIASGSTADIVITYPSANTYCGIGVWVTNGSPVATAESTSNTTTPVADLTTAVGDFCVATVAYRAAASTPCFDWTAANERYDAAGDGAVRMFAGADIVAAGATTSMGGTITNPFGTTESSLVAVAYRA